MSNINDYIKPSDYGHVRKDINKILSLIHDYVAQQPEDEGNKERIMLTPHVKIRTSSVIFGSPSWEESQVRNKENFMFRRVKYSDILAYDLIHTTTGTLTFPLSDTKFGGRCDTNGSSYITISDHDNLDVTNLSLGGLFFIPATDSGDTSEQTLVDKGIYGLYIDPHSTAPNQIKGKITISSIDYEVVGTITPDTWNHIWITFDGLNLKLYIEKVLVATTPAVGNIDTNSTDLTIF